MVILADPVRSPAWAFQVFDSNLQCLPVCVMSSGRGSPKINGGRLGWKLFVSCFNQVTYFANFFTLSHSVCGWIDEIEIDENGYKLYTLYSDFSNWTNFSFWILRKLCINMVIKIGSKTEYFRVLMKFRMTLLLKKELIWWTSTNS